jgi:phosphatidylinositol N-acetylglucosaminyltransferase subunit Q
MVLSNGLMRVFWPSDAPSGPNSGVLIGWRNSEYDVLVIAILQDVEVGISRNKVTF